VALPRIVRQVAKRIVKAVPILRRQILTSTDYRVLSGVEEARSLTSSSGGWLATRTVERQERAYQGLIAAMKRGEPRLDFMVAAAAVTAAGLANPSLLEVGCGSGYYSEAFGDLLGGKLRYTGIDYSDAMIARARARYPSAAFDVADATSMPYPDAAFDIVFNGVSLMHIIDYASAISEAARIARHACILHTVPVFADHQTTFLRKYAYGAPVVEIIFNKPELMALCEQSGLRVVRTWPCIPYDVFDVTGHRSTTETYLFSKTTD
jgi:SAM-dependent methyltransferase